MGVKISQLPAVSSLTGTEIFPVVQSGVTSEASINQIASSIVPYTQGGTGSVARTVQSKLQESVSVLDFGASPSNSASANTAAFLACFAASNGREIFIPAGVYAHNELTYAKSLRFHLRGEMNSYDNTIGTVLNFIPIGTGIGLQIGVDDGSPDVTGPIRDVTVTGITFSTATGSTAIRAQNTALCRIEKNSFEGFSGNILDCRGNVLLKIRDNDIRGSQPASGNYGIWLDSEYFGNYVTEITGNHIYQVNWAGRFCAGRSLTVHGNTIENLRGWTVANPSYGGCFVFETSGYISNATFTKNYCENARGWMFYGAAFTGAILTLTVKDNEFWGSADAANVNPGFGNIPRNKVLNHVVEGNFVLDSNWNAKAYLAIAAVFPTTTIFDTTTTIVQTQVTNKEYEDSLVYSLAPNELLKSNGDFSIITGGTPGTLSVNGSTQPSVNGAATSPPFGWTASGIITGSAWNAVVDAVAGGWVCYVPGSGSTYNTAQITVTIASSPNTSYFALGFTAKGWAAVKLNGASIYDPGSNVSTYKTNVVIFSIAPSTTTFTLTLATNAGNPSFWAEMRLFQIGVAEANEPGTMNGAIYNAVKRLMKRGAY